MVNNYQHYKFVYWVLALQTLLLGFLLPQQSGESYAVTIIIVAMGLILWAVNLSSWVSDVIASALKISKSNLPLKCNPGFIYVMQRKDGVYKIGRTTDIDRRLDQLKKEYGQNFELVRRFVVSDCIEMEKIALRMTLENIHREKGRYELRKLNNIELVSFLENFENLCKELICK